ncbi:MAG: hypothetical protein ABI378_15260 [Chitinophagaceae bacterium]
MTLQLARPHTFHIPVLGIGFSVDTPLKVAQFGISSVISIIEDELLEHLRAKHCQQFNVPFTSVPLKGPECRASRITAYLNQLQDLVASQLEKLKNSSFDINPNLGKYFDLLPEKSPLKSLYLMMKGTSSKAEKEKLEEDLIAAIVPGSIDINIMAKVDNARYDEQGVKLPDEYSDALSALRGFAQSKLASSIVFSAGYNPRLYNYAEQFPDFYPDENGYLKKKIILKVSDYRSALVQGKIFAKKGLWVSEFRVESGLNCGGHAFPTDGLLFGPILEEFKNSRKALSEELFAMCNAALEAKGHHVFQECPAQFISAQGGIGNGEEHQFLLDYYGLDSAGWGSPFLLVPEATNVEEKTLDQLSVAKKEDYFLSNASPLGVPFNNFRPSTSEAQRKNRIAKNRPGSPCYKKYLSSNTEFTDEPICTASRQYQNLKIKQLRAQELPELELEKAIAKVEEKDCLCEGLTASVQLKNDMAIPHKLDAVAICPGPNLAYFSGVFSLQQMVGHIYGRENLLNKVPRPNMFINELQMYITYLKKEMAEGPSNEKTQRHHQKFQNNLLAGIQYYRGIAPEWKDGEEMLGQLNEMEAELS